MEEIKEMMSPDGFGPSCPFCQPVCREREEERRENAGIPFSSGVESGELIPRRPTEAS